MKGKKRTDKKEIPIPKDAYTNMNDRRVFSMVPEIGKPRNEWKCLTIGQVVSFERGTMYPNENFRVLFPAEWEAAYGVAPLPEFLYSGMYATTLAISRMIVLYEVLVNTLGLEPANAVMDFATYSIIEKTDVSLGFEANMKNKVLFSSKVLSSDAWSKLFKVTLTPESIERFKTAWLPQALKFLKNQKGKEIEIWVSIDGSNSDCAVNNEYSDLPQEGKSKSGNSGTIVAYIYAVDAETGLPIILTSGRATRWTPRRSLTSSPGSRGATSRSRASSWIAYSAANPSWTTSRGKAGTG